MHVCVRKRRVFGPRGLTVIICFPQSYEILTFHIAELHLLPGLTKLSQTTRFLWFKGKTGLTENKSEQELDIVRLARPPHGAERTCFTSAKYERPESSCEPAPRLLISRNKKINSIQAQRRGIIFKSHLIAV